MFFMILIIEFILLGILFGTITGIIPGIHPNLIAVLCLSLLFQTEVSYNLIAFIVSMTITNSFLDFLPSIFFGAPDESTILSVLPGHTFMLNGIGYEAVVLTVIGGLGIIIITTIALPILLFVIPLLYNFIFPYMAFILIFICLWMILLEKRKITAFIIFLFSGILGMLILNVPNSIFPSLTGLFGLSTLIISLSVNPDIPKQITKNIEIKNTKKGIITGLASGLLVGSLPGVGSAQATVLASEFTGASTKDLLIAMGGINTANSIFSFISIYTIGKARSGTAIAIKEILYNFSFYDLLFLISIALISAGIASIITLKLGKVFAKIVEKVNYRTISIITIIIINFMTIYLTGYIGMLILFTSTSLGILTSFLKVKKINLMGILLLPCILFFLGI